MSLKVASIQMRMSESYDLNIAKAEYFVREAVINGAKIVLLPELFSSLYFCQERDTKYFSLAQERKNSPLIKKFSTLAKELKVVLPISYFEKDKNEYYNSLVVIDADGKILDNYRKTHIPDGPGYEEKFYFNNGNSGFKVFDTAYAKIGVGICWDQWFSESARILTLKGSELLFYPTAIGSEPEIKLDSKNMWQNVQIGHAIANTIPLITANRVSKETSVSCELTFYGSSFMCNHRGEVVVEASRESEEIIYAEFELEKIKEDREYWGLLRDRAPKSYSDITE
ncbi:MAG: N-carbamoylputrescine amidase [Helicobacteraceae bacterium]|nr:N-carbamoylputrescine amidase [Helicobacteraceae bacterium]